MAGASAFILFFFIYILFFAVIVPINVMWTFSNCAVGKLSKINQLHDRTFHCDNLYLHFVECFPLTMILVALSPELTDIFLTVGSFETDFM